MSMTLPFVQVISRRFTCFNFQHKYNLLVDPKQTVMCSNFHILTIFYALLLVFHVLCILFMLHIMHYITQYLCYKYVIYLLSDMLCTSYKYVIFVFYSFPHMPCHYIYTTQYSYTVCLGSRFLFGILHLLCLKWQCVIERYC